MSTRQYAPANITVEQLAANPFMMGQHLFHTIASVQFPSENGNNHWIMSSGSDKLLELLADMPHSRPSSVERKFTYPCVFTNPRKPGRQIKIEPLIGTADDGVYLRRSDIEKLGLRYTGFVANTRQGECRLWEGVHFNIPNDYNAGQTTYSTLHVYELPLWVHKVPRADNAGNSKKHGIVGTPMLANHVFFMHCGDAHLIDLAVLRASPPLLSCFDKMRPLAWAGLVEPDAPGQAIGVKIGRPFPGRALDVALAVAERCPPPAPFDAFAFHSEETLKRMHIRDLSNPEIAKMRPVVREAEACRVCEREDTVVKLEICTRCVQERRPQRALYCGQACQRKDWKERHKGEHAGELPWGIQDRATRECVRHTNGDYSVPLYSASY
ncbi:hypothetical protein EV122DRAFT_226531 [Schizophyllum commune]